MYCDAHCDTLTEIFDKKLDLYKNECHADIERLQKTKCLVQTFAIWSKPEYKGEKAFEYVDNVIDYFYNQYKINSKYLKLILSPLDLEECIKENKIGALLTIEGGDALCKSLYNIDYFYERGIRGITLTWNFKNEIASGIMEKTDEGLTEFGKKVIRKMNEKRMFADVSHLGERSFWDVERLSTLPLIATHSNAKKICNHKRNLTDEQIKAIKNSKGFMGLNFYPLFLSENKLCTISDIKKHYDYIMEIGGENILGFGGDFDGVDFLPENVCGVESMKSIEEVIFKNETNEFVKKRVLYGNFAEIISRL